MLLPKLPRRLGWRQRPRTSPRKVGKYTAAQWAWNSALMAEWRVLYGTMLACAVTGRTASLVVGHIIDRSLEPRLRMDRTNVAPITWAVNTQMKVDLRYRAEAQRLMRFWNERWQIRHKGVVSDA